MNVYEDWTREKIIEHLEAYSFGLHELGNLAIRQQNEIRKLKQRLDGIDNIREVFHG